MRIAFLAFVACGVSIQAARGDDPAAKNDDVLQLALRAPTVENLPLLLKAAQDASHCFPRPSRASRAIAQLGERAVPEIVNQIKLRRRQPWTSQVDNLFLLAQIGSDAEAALPLLTELVESPETHKYLRHFAESARAAIQKDVVALTRLAGTGTDFGHIALLSIEQMGAEARAAGPAILDMARKNPTRKRRCLAALEAIDPQLAETLASEIVNP